MCSHPTTNTPTPLPPDELAKYLRFATRLARNLTRRPDIDYEACASDALLDALDTLPSGGPGFQLYLAARVYSRLGTELRAEARRQAHVRTMDWEDLDELAAPDDTLDALDGLSPADCDLALDVLVNKVTERAAAALRGTTQRQVRNRLAIIRKFLTRQMEAVK